MQFEGLIEGRLPLTDTSVRKSLSVESGKVIVPSIYASPAASSGLKNSER